METLRIRKKSPEQIVLEKIFKGSRIATAQENREEREALTLLEDDGLVIKDHNFAMLTEKGLLEHYRNMDEEAKETLIRYAEGFPIENEAKKADMWLRLRGIEIDGLFKEDLEKQGDKKIAIVSRKVLL